MAYSKVPVNLQVDLKDIPTKLGKQYQNDMFIGDYNNSNIYHFKLNRDRTGLVLSNTQHSN